MTERERIEQLIRHADLMGSPPMAMTGVLVGDLRWLMTTLENAEDELEVWRADEDA